MVFSSAVLFLFECLTPLSVPMVDGIPSIRENPGRVYGLEYVSRA